jgi:hypothetical protein
VSSIRTLVPLVFAVSLFGQSETNAVPNPGKVIVQGLRNQTQDNLGTFKPTILSGIFQPPSLPDTVAKCAVPLLEAPIAAGNFVIAQVKPPKSFIDNMVIAHALPACPAPQE